MSVNIEEHMGLVTHIVKKYLNNGSYRIEFDDLFQEGCIGLVKAGRTFKAEKGFRFSTYASICIDNQVKMYIRKLKKYQVEDTILDRPFQNEENDEMNSLGDILPCRKYGTEDGAVANEIMVYMHTEKKRRANDADIKQKRCLLLRMKGYKQKEAAKILGVSQSIISRYENRVRKKIYEDWVKN